jgi:diguanylate cyclase (GGDEF)-like protein
LESQFKKQTFLDDLTGLYNSRYLKYAITNSILRCKKPNDKFSVLFIDVDHFKMINDKNGHLVGSEFLVAIGRTIRNAIRNLDPVFRYGGDEFVVLLNDMGTNAAKEIAERIRKNIERRVFVIQGVRLQATVSIGVACFPEHASEKDSLLKLADEAMYSAKKDSRNAVHLAYGLEKTEKRKQFAVVK